MTENRMGIFRTVYEIEVFSEGPLDLWEGEEPENPNALQQIDYLITEGPCIGMVTWKSSERVPSHEVQTNLVRIGNDGEFFLNDEEE